MAAGPCVRNYAVCICAYPGEWLFVTRRTGEALPAFPVLSSSAPAECKGLSIGVAFV